MFTRDVIRPICRARAGSAARAVRLQRAPALPGRWEPRFCWARTTLCAQVRPSLAKYLGRFRRCGAAQIMVVIRPGLVKRSCRDSAACTARFAASLGFWGIFVRKLVGLDLGHLSDVPFLPLCSVLLFRT